MVRNHAPLGFDELDIGFSFSHSSLGIELMVMCFPLPNWQNEVSEIQQRLETMASLEKEFESLRGERDDAGNKSASSSNKRPGGVGFRRWYGDDER